MIVCDVETCCELCGVKLTFKVILDRRAKVVSLRGAYCLACSASEAKKGRKHPWHGDSEEYDYVTFPTSEKGET